MIWGLQNNDSEEIVQMWAWTVSKDQMKCRRCDGENVLDDKSRQNTKDVDTFRRALDKNSKNQMLEELIRWSWIVILSRWSWKKDVANGFNSRNKPACGHCRHCQQLRLIQSIGEDEQKPDNFGASLAPAQGDNVATNTIIEQSPLFLASLNTVVNTWAQMGRKSYRGKHGSNQLTAGHRQGKINHHGASSARKPVSQSPIVSASKTHPLAGSDIRLITRSSTSSPPSLRALFTDLEPCSWVAYSRRPARRWSSANWRCFSEPCSKTLCWSEFASVLVILDSLCWIQ